MEDEADHGYYSLLLYFVAPRRLVEWHPLVGRWPEVVTKKKMIMKKDPTYYPGDIPRPSKE